MQLEEGVKKSRVSGEETSVFLLHEFFGMGFFTPHLLVVLLLLIIVIFIALLLSSPSSPGFSSTRIKAKATERGKRLSIWISSKKGTASDLNPAH